MSAITAKTAKTSYGATSAKTAIIFRYGGGGGAGVLNEKTSRGFWRKWVAYVPPAETGPQPQQPALADTGPADWAHWWHHVFPVTELVPWAQAGEAIQARYRRGQMAREYLRQLEAGEIGGRQESPRLFARVPGGSEGDPSP